MGTSAGQVRVEGLNKTLTALQRLGVEAQDLKDTMSAIAAEGAQLASGYAPSRSGALKRTVRGNKAKAKAIVLAGKARVRYAGAVNYGWPQGKKSHGARRRGGWPVGMKAHLFMQKADAALAPKALVLLEKGLAEAAQKAGLE